MQGVTRSLNKGVVMNKIVFLLTLAVVSFFCGTFAMQRQELSPVAEQVNEQETRRREAIRRHEQRMAFQREVDAHWAHVEQEWQQLERERRYQQYLQQQLESGAEGAAFQ